MSTKRSRRRQRKSKQNNKKYQNKIQNQHKHKNKVEVNYADKFKIIERNMNSILLSGYIRQIKPLVLNGNAIPVDVEQLCHSYFADEPNNLHKVIIPAITHITFEQNKKLKRKIAHCVLKFNESFNELNRYEKRMICNRIIQRKKLPIHELRAWPVASDAMSDQLYLIEYILFKRYNCLKTLDLSEIDLNDNHILYLCNSIENIIKYKSMEINNCNKLQTSNNNIWMQKHSKQRPSDLQKKHVQNQSSNKNEKTAKKTKKRPIYSLDKRVQKEYERQLEKKRIMRQKPDKIVIKMKLDAINVSYNNISDKHLAFLLRTIKKHIPNLRSLDLSCTNISNKSLPTIMKYNIKGLRIELSGCKRVTVKGLNKYQRTDYEDENPVRYVYCENMVYFTNEQEEYGQCDNKPKGGKYVRGKGKKFRGNRKRMLFTGQDGIETGYLSECDGSWWNYR